MRDVISLNHILCPTDLSPHSEEVVGAAIQLADQFQARLTLLTVVEDGFPHSEIYRSLTDVGISDVIGGVSKQVGKDLDDLAERLRDPAVDMSTLVVVGNPVKQILTIAEELSSDVIVMGSMGRNPLDRALLGSVVEKVLRRAPCHVLMIKPPSERDEE